MLKNEAREFIKARGDQISEARQRAALFLISGIEFSAALQTSGMERQHLLTRLARLIERERLKGVRRHWSYDLNRHIALKQAYDHLKQPELQRSQRAKRERHTVLSK